MEKRTPAIQGSERMTPTSHAMSSKVVRAIRTHRVGLTSTVHGKRASAGRSTFERIALRLMGGRYGRRRF